VAAGYFGDDGKIKIETATELATKLTKAGATLDE